MKPLVRAAALLLLPAGTVWAQGNVLPAGTATIQWGPARLGLGIAPVVRAPRVAACAPGNSLPACQVPPARVARPVARAVPPVPRPGPAVSNGWIRGNGNGHNSAGPPNQAQERAVQQAAMGDQFGGRIIPPNILKILADRRIEPITAYLLWQAARKPMEEWTMRQLQDLTATLPTLVETGMALAEIQELYKFLELDPGDVFTPQFGQDWQTRSTRFDATSTAAVAEISSADCQADPGLMTVATYRSCVARGQ